MNVLGIETSCDETAAALVDETGDPAHPWRIRSNVVASQVLIHREWGGVVPELAARQHLRDICGVVERALEEAGSRLEEVDAVAVTQGPGLIGSLLVGVSFAKSLAVSRGIPLVAVNHLAGHIESLALEHGPLPMPAVVLVVSGGHTSLYHVPAPGDYRLIGRTRDDAAGEAYDKVARLLGLGYPGGPIIDHLALKGDDRAVEFPVARLTHADRNPLPALERPVGYKAALLVQTDFSFSGVKTAVARYVRHRIEASGAMASSDTPVLSEHEVANICASFQHAVIAALLERTFDAARWFDVRSVGIAGGVSANSRLRADAVSYGDRLGVPVYVPSLPLATDNAAMIAAAGLRRVAARVTAVPDFSAEAALAL